MTAKLAPPAGALLSLFRTRLDKQIVIQQPVMSGTMQKFQDWLTLSAAIQPLSGIESSGAIDPTNVVTTTVWIEFVTGVRPRMRLKYQDRLLEIISVINLLEANLVLELVVKEAVT